MSELTVQNSIQFFVKEVSIIAKNGAKLDLKMIYEETYKGWTLLVWGLFFF